MPSTDTTEQTQENLAQEEQNLPKSPETTENPQESLQEDKTEAQTQEPQPEIPQPDTTEKDAGNPEITQPKEEITDTPAGGTSFSKEELEKTLNAEMIEFLKGSPEFVTQVHQTLLLTQEVYNAHLLLVGKFQEALEFSNTNNEAIAKTKAEFENKYQEFITKSAEILSLATRIEELKGELEAADIQGLKLELQDKLATISANEFLREFENLKERLENTTTQTQEDLRGSKEALQDTQEVIALHNEKLREFEAKIEETKEAIAQKESLLNTLSQNAQKVDEKLSALNLDALRADLQVALDSLKTDEFLSAFENLRNEFVLIYDLLPNTTKQETSLLEIKQDAHKRAQEQLAKSQESLKAKEQNKKDLENEIAILEESLRNAQPEQTAQIEEQLNAKREALQSLLEQISQNQSEIEEAHVHERETKEDLEEFLQSQEQKESQNLQTLKNELALLQESIENISGEEKAWALREAQMLEAEIKLLESKRDASTASEERKSAEELIPRLQEELKELTKARRELESERDIAEEQIANATTDAQREWLSNYKMQVLKDLSAKVAQIEAKSAEIARERELYADAKERLIANLEKELTANTSKLEAMQQNSSVLTEKQKALEEECALLEAQKLNTTGEQREAIAQELLKKEEALRALKTQVQAALKAHKEQSALCKELALTIANEKKAVECHAKEFEKAFLEFQRDELEREIAKASGEKAAQLEAEKQAKQQAIDTLTTEIATLQEQMQETLQKLEETKEQNAKDLTSAEFATKAFVWEKEGVLLQKIAENQDAINTNQQALLNNAQTLAGIKTFSNGIALPALSTHNPVPTANNHIANKLYVDNQGGIRNLGNSATANANFGIDFRTATHFVVNMTARSYLSVANWGGIAGKSGTISVLTAQNLLGFRAPFNFRVAQSGFTGHEVFSYFVYSASLIRLVRS